MVGGASGFMELVLLHLLSLCAGLSWKVRLYKVIMAKKMYH